MPAAKDSILVECLKNIGSTSTLAFNSRSLTDVPRVTLNIENARVGSYSYNHSYYCVTKRFDVKETSGVMDIDIEGALCREPVLRPGPNVPYGMKMRVIPEQYRVSIETRIEILSDDPLFSYEPCLQSAVFSEENHPAFEMARKSFAFFEGKGFRWLSDVERFRSEYMTEPPKEGPWIQRFTTEAYTRQGETALPAPVGWVSDGRSFIMAMASDNPYELGIRWGPCLHSNIAAAKTGAGWLSAKSVIYILPADLKMLIDMFREDFPDAGADVSSDLPELWPLDKGVLLDGMENAGCSGWIAEGSSLGPYSSSGKWTNGNLHMVLYPEGVTEGNGSALWEIPDGKGEAVAAKSLKKHLDENPELSHISLDVMDRGEDAEIEVFIKNGESISAQEKYKLHPMATRRIVVPLGCVGNPAADGIYLGIRTEKTNKPCRIVIDNLRGFKGR